MHTPQGKHDVPAVSSSVSRPPRAPSPSADKGLASSIESADSEAGDLPDPNDIDIFTLAPLTALRMLCEGLHALVRVTGDVPPTPPVSAPGTPKSELVQIEKENTNPALKENCRRSSNVSAMGDDDAVPAKAKTPIGSPEAHPTETLNVVDARTEPLSVQHGIITRKFYSKRPPPIALEDYLMRLHKYCPMSTAVYLATSLYIHRLAVLKRLLPVTGRNVHRLVLAGLRVTSKALDDLGHSHTRFAKVGGVTERELGRLEISFCFITDFELKVDREMLLSHARLVRDGSHSFGRPANFQPKLPPLREKRLVVGQNRPTTIVNAEAPATA